MTMRSRTAVGWLALLLCSLGLVWSGAKAQDGIDFARAQELRRKSQNGQKLTADEQAYLDRALKALQQGQRPNGGKPGAIVSPSTKDMQPLSDMSATETYKGEDGGLYGKGQNVPPPKHLAAALKLAESIRPLNAEGQPDPNGKIGMISVGMSNTTQVFSRFVQMANRDPDKSPQLVIVDGAQGGMEAQAWSQPEGIERNGRPSPWTVLAQRVAQSGLTPAQVQVVWTKMARANPAAQGAFPKHAVAMQDQMVTILQDLKRTYPNLKLAYLSSRTYAGYATTGLNPEPYAYEGAFTMRWLIQDQIAGDPSLNYDPQQARVRVPLLLWGPYLWSNGETGRKLDDLKYSASDFAPDGTHPNDSGQRKVAEQLLRFFKNDPTTKGWFTSAR